MSNQKTNSESLSQASSIFEFLTELKKLQTVHTRDVANFEQVLWLHDIPKETGCFTRSWELLAGMTVEEVDRWVEIKKPSLAAPPELPDKLEAFVSEKELENSSQEQPKFVDPSPDLLLKYFIVPDEEATERQILSINQNSEIFDL